MDRTSNFSANCDAIASRCALFATRRLARTLTRLYDAELTATGLRGTQFNVLVAIARSRGRTLTELGDALGMDRTTLTHALRPLRRAHLVRDANNIDRRVRTVELTSLGKQRVSAGMVGWQRAQEQVEATRSAVDWSELNAQLRRLNRLLIVDGQSQ
ncbi:MAG: winged helix-turn-helix transcriptional regulator [Proteobacteria bacterium]|nr:winged helix-turn-helix transcriptional regulator [Pseudomonadota bacterium]